MNNTFAFYLQKYFLSYLTTQRQYSENTIDSYRDTFRLMIIYLNTSGYTVSSLPVVDLSASIILDFLEWLGKERKNSTATKNVRLAHLISFHQFIMITTPELSFHCSEIINIPFMKVEKKIPQYLSEIETKHLLCAPDSNSKDGLRHLAILTLLYDSV